MKIKQKKGISLIVLVITIIVMIILAAAIILSLQSSGIIGRANEAKAETDAANYKELITIAHAEWLLMDATAQEENGGSFVTYAENKLEESGMNPDNYVIEETGEAKLCVAKIGNVKYTELQIAVDDAYEMENAKIELVNNINLNEEVYIYDGEIVTLDLKGYTINSVGNAIRISGTLTVMDSSNNKKGMMKAVSDKTKYNEQYDLNNDGVIGQADMDKISEYFGTVILETTAEEIKKCDTNLDGGINVSDYSAIGRHMNDAYTFFVSSGILTIDGINKESFSGQPEVIYNKDGSVNGYEF